MLGMENQALLDKYEVELDAASMPVELRRNATGVTCKGHEIESGREVAIEFVHTRSLDPETRRKVEADAIAAQQISHVNVPRLYDFAFDGKDLVYVTEYFDGITAESWVITNGPMPVRAVLHVALQMVSALGAATFQLVMHRAIHPGNLLIVSGQTAEGDAPLIKVLHFGRPDPKLFRSSGKSGTGLNKSAPFASPEQLETGAVDFRSEIYSLGCTLWSLLTGVPPFNAPGKPLAGARMAAAMKRFKGVPGKMRRLITQMAATNPDDRPLDPVVMTQQLQDCLASVERREAIARKLGIPATWHRRRIAKPVGPLALRPFAMAAVLLAAALAAFAITNGSSVNALWKKFANRGPIGTPIGVTETSPARSETNADKRTENNDAATVVSEAVLLKNLNAQKSSANNSPSTPSADTSPAPTTPAPVVASANQNATEASPNSEPNESAQQTGPPPSPNVAAARAESQPPSPDEQSTKTDASPLTDTTPSATPAVADTTTETAKIKSTEPASIAESAPLSENKVPRAELIEGPSPKPAVPRAELVEPPPPTEGPDDAKHATSSMERMENVPRAELIEPPPNSSAKTNPQKRARSPYALSKSELAAIRNASRRANRARIWADGDGAMVQTPDGMVHARLVGTTPDGRWMLSLPSRKIMIVPPPPEFVPR